MEPQTIDSIVAELRRQHDHAQQQVTALQSELSTAEKDRDRIDAALAALTGTAKSTANSRTPQNLKKNAQTPSPTKAAVIAAMRSVLKETVELEADALRKAVEERLSDDGFNRSGMAMRFKEACREPLFVVTPTGVRLAERESVTVNAPKQAMEAKSPARQTA